MGSPYIPTTPGWSNGPLSKNPLLQPTPTSPYTQSSTATSAGASSTGTGTSSFRDGYISAGKESPSALQEALKAERLSPHGGSAAGSSFLNLTSVAGSVYGPSPHGHPHMLNPYSSAYMSSPQDYGASALYSNPGAWISPVSYSPKLRNKMRLSPPGDPIHHHHHHHHPHS